MAEKNCYFIKTDDSNGFNNVLLNEWSASLCGINLGGSIFRATALPFGLTQSPGRFQELNSVCVNYLNINGHSCYLYLDDRIMVFNYPNATIKKHHTFLGGAILGLMLTGFGGFVSYNKSKLEPTREIDFLGFLLNSEKQLISVPRAKYDKAMIQIDQFLEGDMLDIQLLEKIRGKLVSWLICIPICKLMIREQNEIIKQAYAQDSWKWRWNQLADSNLLIELKAWKQLKYMSLQRAWREERHVVYQIDETRMQALYTDASQYALGAKLYNLDNQMVEDKLIQPSEDDLIDECFFQYSIDETDEPIHVKEMITVFKVRVFAVHFKKN